MNLFLRLLLLLVTVSFRPRSAPLGPTRKRFIVWPPDLDVLFHVNNGVYLSMLDVARVDLMLRSGVGARLRKHGIYPVVAAETIRFRRSLKLFQAFEVETTVIGWDEKALLIQHHFLRRGELVADAVVRARFLKRQGGTVSSRELLELVGHTHPHPRCPPGSRLGTARTLARTRRKVWYAAGVRSQTGPGAFAWALLAPTLAFAEVSAGSHAPRGLGLRWSDPDSLAVTTEAEFEARLSARLGHAAFDPGASGRLLAVSWRGSPERCHVELQLLHGAEVAGTRLLESPSGDCRSLFPALLTVAALLIESRPLVTEAEAGAEPKPAPPSVSQPPRATPPAAPPNQYPRGKRRCC